MEITSGWYSCLFATIAGLLSIFGSASLFLSSRMMKQTKQNQKPRITDVVETNPIGCAVENLAVLEAKEIIINEVGWMSLCDFIFSIWTIIGWLPQLWNGETWWSGFCYFGGLIMEFSGCGSILWYSIIALQCLRLLTCDHVNENRQKEQYLHHIFVWFFTCLSSLMPIIFNGYGNVIKYCA